MASTDKHFEAFADHTLLKHAILHAYLQRWAFKILQWAGAGDTVYFVDGFAGAGSDNAGNPGSPMIACRIAQQVRAHFRSKSPASECRLRVIAVESAPGTLLRLETQLTPFNRVDPGCVRTMLGSVSDQINDIVAETGPRPTLFFLDPFGISGLVASTYPTMLSGQHNEVFALFDDIGAARLRGVVHAGAGIEQQLQALKELPSMFPELDRQVANDLAAEADKKRRVEEQYGPAARRSISLALGDSNWEEELRDLSPDAARVELIVRFVRRLIASGAAYVQVLPMHSESGGHKYCLVHASKSLSGYMAMKEAVSESLNKNDLSPTMRHRIRVDLSIPFPEILAYLQGRFGGQSIRWSATDRNNSTVRRALLSETALFPFQASEIKSELRARGWLLRNNRIEMCQIPSPT
jgi:three-Cys-motif partner protein